MEIRGKSKESFLNELKRPYLASFITLFSKKQKEFWLGHPLFFLRFASSDRPKFWAFPLKKKRVNDVFEPFLCRTGVSVVDPFSHAVLILPQHPPTFPPY